MLSRSPADLPALCRLAPGSSLSLKGCIHAKGSVSGHSALAPQRGASSETPGCPGSGDCAVVGEEPSLFGKYLWTGGQAAEMDGPLGRGRK